MVLNVSEEQKKVIESQGYMVVEFKLWCQKLGKMILEYAAKVIDTFQAIFLFIQEQAIKAFKHIKNFVEQLSNELEPYISSLDYMDCEKKKYLFARSLGRAYEVNVEEKLFITDAEIGVESV